MTESREPQYDVALSFAAEDRAYVQSVAQILRDSRIRIFYDEYEQVALWGKDLYTHLDDIYRTKSRYCVLFISRHYAKKVWTNHERRSAQARAIRENVEYILPARFDDTAVDGLPDTIAYLDISDMSPKKFAKLVKEKVGPRYSGPGFPTKIDRLWSAMGAKGAGKSEKRRIHRIAYSFYNALSYMAPDERRVVAGIFAFGCDAELPKGVHISLDLISRMLGMEKESIVQHLAKIRTLDIKAEVRESQIAIKHGELAPDDKDIMLSYWCRSSPWDDDSTEIAMRSVHCAADHFCTNHGVSVVVNLDFSRLSKSAIGLSARDESPTQ
ncbi:toll/interleukin-1 receptor domain-containing protein [Kitasatospora sp. NPDC048286]|uniref:toll/interleukin-1 receptor domain-containing protein n=1 Tax=Kitasatospora sp. NPDC048286 TaxID=3364047 RepID=UPI00371BA084